MNNMVVISYLSGEGWQSYNDLFAHSNIFISMTHICGSGP